jgi:hypothetical protein
MRLIVTPGSVFQVHEQVPGLLHYLRLDRMPGSTSAS